MSYSSLDATPVVRGEFVYQGAFFVDVGGPLKWHSRASHADLKAYLDGKVPKDQVAHWYEAQLIHYGLQRSKDKNTPKVRLQQAINQKKLNVPQHILNAEAQMKKEFVAGIRKATASATKSAKPAVSDAAVTSKKRKQSDEQPENVSQANKKTKITMKVGDVEVSIDRDVIATPRKGTKTPQKKTPQPKATQASNKSNKSQNDSNIRATPAKPKGNVQPTLNTPRIPASAPSARKPSPTKTPVKAKPQTKVKKEEFPSPSDSTIRSPNIKPEPKTEADTNQTSSRYLTGVYNISCPQLEQQYPNDANSLRLFLCVDNETGKIWGGFELAPKSGVLLITGDYTNPDAWLSFGWRARDSERGGLKFGRDCSGEIQLRRNGVQGVFYNMFPEPVEFEGERRTGPLWSGRSAWQYEREWNGFVKEAYGR